MGEVFLACASGPSNFSKLLVVKRLQAAFVEDPEFVTMLMEEARIAARLRHPNIVQTYEVGSDSEGPYIAMEYLEGQALYAIQRRAKEKPELFPRDLLYFPILDALAGLEHAHNLADYDGTPLGLVHRDMSPQNVFVTYQGEVKIVDFGIAKIRGRVGETSKGVLKGKVRYMAPEQIRGQQVDRRADIFCMGILLWETATGMRMWKDHEDLDIIRALLDGDVSASPAAKNPDVPPAIDAICRRALAVAPAERYATAGEVHADLERFLTDSGAVKVRRRELGPSLSALYKDRQVEINGLIEKRLTQLREKEAARKEAAEKGVPVDDIAPNESEPLDLAGSMRNLPVIAEEESRPDREHGEPEAATLLAVTTTATKPRWSAIVVASVVVVLGSFLVLFFLRGRGAHDPKPAPVEIRLHVSTSPETARVSIDGKPVSSPFEGALPKDEREHVVRVEADGFEPQSRIVLYEKDHTLSIALTKSPETPASTSSSPSSTASSPAPALSSARRPTPPPSTSHAPSAQPTRNPNLEITRER